MHDQPWQKFRNWEESNCYHTQQAALNLRLQITICFDTCPIYSRGRNLENMKAVEVGLTEFFTSKTREWYRRGLIIFAERWLKIIESDGHYFEE